MTALAVPPGTAEQLARIARFRDLEETQPEELDAVALFLIGDVGGADKATELWAQLRAGECARLWYLITDDWDDRDLDELSEQQCTRLDLTATEDQVEQARYAVTRDRLCHDIEQAVWSARYAAGEDRRAAARRQHKADIEAAIHRHPAGSRPATIPAHLRTCSLPDYLRQKGELR